MKLYRIGVYSRIMNLTTKRVLIIGGSSSLVPTLYRIAKAESFEITASFRGDLTHSQDMNIQWLNLELSEKDSIDGFLEELNNIKFDRILFLIGSVTNKYFLKMTYSEIANYHLTYAVNSLYLLQKCLSNIKETSNILVMSSRAGSNASFDVHYSAVKSALEAYVRSSAQALAENQSIVAISSGLIEGSKMYLDMKAEHQISHKIRAGGSLITINELCSEIWSLQPHKTIKDNGKTIHIGPVY